ncbi:MAG: ATP-binding protein, partial [Anaerolineae bacterium]|nr:ATP-binding protein [Anaerolineae bacterium]
MPINADQIRRLLQKEGPKVDLKLTLPLKTKDDKAKFVKHVIALANTPRGTGYLLIGVDDKTKK